MTRRRGWDRNRRRGRYVGDQPITDTYAILLLYVDGIHNRIHRCRHIHVYLVRLEFDQRLSGRHAIAGAHAHSRDECLVDRIAEMLYENGDRPLARNRLLRGTFRGSHILTTPS